MTDCRKHEGELANHAASVKGIDTNKDEAKYTEERKDSNIRDRRSVVESNQLIYN